MMNKDISEIEFNDIAFIEQENRKAIILIGKTKETAHKLHNAVGKGFNFKHKPEPNGSYTFGLEVTEYAKTIILETTLKKDNYPQLLWLDNSSISDVIIAYRDGKNIELIQPSFPLNSWINPN
ncbi:hypothetical protein K5L04_06955 [Flavobacterium psychrophilum]|nr:hypothetical protein [Flavobacterium psychrophilum]QZK99448.1 hypothetical protein K5L04_06840 [Flavobacterium psychrophilum]QZK99471.1 hypothetical protein K5L04_06955 [Flavobacterium psychrophilum]